jgi:hypothetical protein
MQVQKLQTFAKLEASDTGPYSILLNISTILLAFGEFIVSSIAKLKSKKKNEIMQSFTKFNGRQSTSFSFYVLLNNSDTSYTT